MGIRVTGIIDKKLDARDIFNILGEMCEECHLYRLEDCAKIKFVYNKEDRELFTSTENKEENYYSFLNSETYTTLIMGSDSVGLGIVTKILSHFGGWMFNEEFENMGYTFIPKE